MNLGFTLRHRLDAFWPTFLGAHLDPRTRALHLVGNAVFFGILIATAATAHWAWMPLCFLGYVPSWIGHFAFEGNAPVTVGSPFVSGLCDLKIMGLTLSGTLDAETERLFGSARPMPGAPPMHGLEEELAYQERLRLRIRADIPEHPFTAYWPIFVLKHQRAVNIAVHVAAMVFLYTTIAFAIATRRWELLLLVPLSQTAGLVAHALTERTHIDFGDAVFSMRAFACLNRMMVLVLTGRYGRELARIQRILEEWQAARVREIPA